MRHNIPFYANTSKGINCLQACLKSSLEAIPPYRHLNFAELEELTGFEEGMLTWPMRTYLTLSKMGYTLAIYDLMDFSEFSTKPLEYMVKVFGKDAAELYSKNSNIVQAVEDSRDLLKTSNVSLNRSVPSLATLQELIENNFLCICHVDQSIIAGGSEQDDHSILVFDVLNTDVIAHNPGPPPEANQIIDKDVFERAWAFPTDYNKTILGIKAG